MKTTLRIDITVTGDFHDDQAAIEHAAAKLREFRPDDEPDESCKIVVHKAGGTVRRLVAGSQVGVTDGAA